MISSQMHLNSHTLLLASMFLITVDTGGPTLMLIKCVQILYEMSSYFHKKMEDLLRKFITCVPINSNSYNS